MSDYISRQSVINVINDVANSRPYKVIGRRETYSQYNEGWTDGLNRLEKNIGALPSADVQPVVHWIPCSERLPENDCQCIVTAKVKHVDDYPDYEVDTADYTDGIFTTANSWWGIESIIAWMPLPKGYQEGKFDE